MADIYLACKCISSDAKQVLSTALTVAEMLAAKHLDDVTREITRLKNKNERVPAHLPHIQDLAVQSLRNIKKLDNEVSAMPTCEWLSQQKE